MAEIRRLFWRLVLQGPVAVQQVLAWSYWRCHHQWQAMACHYRRQALKLYELQL